MEDWMKISNKVRTRFAPSPTGMLHIGGLRTALYAYLFAKKNKGDFILRIEDTDEERQKVGAEDLIYRTLRDTNLIYDEGPDVGGKYGPYIQTQRKDIYLKYIEKLLENGSAYYCFCSKERLAKLKSNGIGKYDKCCLKIPLNEARERAKKEKHVIRQNIPQIKGEESFFDLVFGKVSVNYEDMEDGILIKSDNMPTYNFANVVDDYLMKITHVIRGVEYLSSTPKYNLLYKSFGFPIPQYIHVQPIMRDATHKLSKRHGDANYEDFLKKGFLKNAILNYIALLGWSPKDDSEKMSLEEMQEKFDISGLSKSPSIFDENKMKWLNSLYLSKMNFEEFHKKAMFYYNKLDYLKNLNLVQLSNMLQKRIEIFDDINNITEFAKNFIIDLNLFINTKNNTNKKLAKKTLPNLLDLVIKNKDPNLIIEELKQFAQKYDLNFKQVTWILRIAMTMKEVTPGGIHEMLIFFGKDIIIERMKKVINELKIISE